MRVGYLPYLNVAPFYWKSNTWEVELVPSVPSEFGKLALQGQVDAGIMSVQDLFLQSSEFEPLGIYGICTHHKAQSVLLFSEIPITDLSGKTIGATKETSTSVKLLELLLKQRYKLQININRSYTKEIAWLLIGDSALREKKISKMPYIYDLGEEWTQWQNLPFVFARWVVRRSLTSFQKDVLLGKVRDSFTQGMANLQDVAAFRAQSSVLDADDICAYLRNFNYVIGPEEEAGLSQFQALLEKL